MSANFYEKIWDVNKANEEDSFQINWLNKLLYLPNY